MTNSSDRLVWIDCEMTGLDLNNDELVEIAVVVTDFDLNILDPGLDIVIKPDASALENMGDFVRNMHTSSGLIEEIPNGCTLSLTHEIDPQWAAYEEQTRKGWGVILESLSRVMEDTK